MSISELVIRIVIAFLTLLILTRIMGRKELSQITFFNFISGIAIGTIGASLAIDSTLSIQNGLIALLVWSALTIAMAIADIKSKKARIAIEGQPLILIKKGQIMESTLQKARLDIDTLNALLRQKNVFSLADVDYAIFETNGKLSVMKKEAQQSPTKSDLNVVQNKPNLFPLSTGIIADGKVNTTNMEKLNLDEQWLNKQLQSAGIPSVSDVFYAEVQKDGTLYIDKKDDVVQ